MVYLLIKLTSRLYSSFNISKTKAMNLDKCYFRHVKDEDRIDLTFLLKVSDSVRQFNFNRNPTETLQTLCNRISANVQKVLKKGIKKKRPEDNLEIKVQFFNHKSHPIPEDSTCFDLFAIQGPVKVSIFEQQFEAIFNAPWILNCILPISILAGFPVYPEQFTTLYTKKEKSTFNWYRGKSINESGNPISEMHVKWESVYSGFTYIPKNEDIGFKLKLECLPANDSIVGPSVETVTKNLVEAGPGKCPFENRHMFTDKKLAGKSFRCVSYNILADLYCDSDHTRTVLYPYCPPYALHIDYRKQVILKEIIGYNADIMCLQEVDRKIFTHCLTPILEEEGMRGVFYKKGKEVAEGLACFYRSDRFRFVKDEYILLSQALQTKQCLAPIWNSVKNNEPLRDRILDRSTVASATIIQSVESENEMLLIGNTHLYFHPDADHIRLLQGGIVIYWLKELKNAIVNENPKKRISLILCGDFNSVPSCGIYQLYTTGLAPHTLPDWHSNVKEAVYNLTLEQDIPLASACGTPPFTNFTADFADCLDYIYYDKWNLRIEQVIPFPSEDELRAHTALPSIVFPSDHIALISDLSYV